MAHLLARVERGTRVVAVAARLEGVHLVRVRFRVRVRVRVRVRALLPGVRLRALLPTPYP